MSIYIWGRCLNLPTASNTVTRFQYALWLILRVIWLPKRLLLGLSNEHGTTRIEFLIFGVQVEGPLGKLFLSESNHNWLIMLNLRHIIAASVSIDRVWLNSSNDAGYILIVVGNISLVLAGARRGSPASALARLVYLVVRRGLPFPWVTFIHNRWLDGMIRVMIR